MARTKKTARKTTSGLSNRHLPPTISREEYLEEREENMRLNNRLIVRAAKIQKLEAEIKELEGVLVKAKEAMDELTDLVNKITPEGTSHNPILIEDQEGEEEAPPVNLVEVKEEDFEKDPEDDPEEDPDEDPEEESEDSNSEEDDD